MLPLDRVICLSLSQRGDRRRRLDGEWKEQIAAGNVPNRPIEYFEALTPQTCLVPGSWSHLPSYYATNLGHLRILEQLWLDDDCNVALVLEDDAKFLPAFTHGVLPFWGSLQKFAPDWLAVFLGGVYQRSPTPVTASMVLNNGSTQSHAYIVNRPGIWRLFDHLWCSPHRVVDWAYSDLMGQDKCVYSPSQWMVTTAAGFSDNGQGWKEQGT